MRTPGQLTKSAIEAAEAIGGVAGAALPASSLAQYLGHDLPTFRNTIKAAPEFGSLSELAPHLRLGDVGMAGNYQVGDNGMLQLLNSGSAHLSGSGVSHGQMVGPRVNRLVDSVGTTFLPGSLNKREMKRVKPRRLPSMFHGGSHSAVDSLDGFNTYWAGVPKSLRDAHLKGVSDAGLATGIGGKLKAYTGGLLQAPQLFGNFRKQQELGAAMAAKARGSRQFLDAASTIADDINDFSGKDRPYLYLRGKGGPPAPHSPQGKALKQLLLRESAAVYDAPSAFASGFKSLLSPRVESVGPAVRTLNQELGRTGGNVAEALKGIRCDASGHHCGSLVETVLQRLNLSDRRVSPSMALPSRAMLNPNLTPIGVVGKQKLLSLLNRSAKIRTGLGLAATAGGAGLGMAAGGAFTDGAAAIRNAVQTALKRKLT